MKNFKSYRKLISYASMGVFMLISIVFFSSYIPMKILQVTEDRLDFTTFLLRYEKKETGEYPYDITCFENNRFDVKNVLIDSWKNTFYYERSDNGQAYLLVSKGKDGILFTDDDISRSSKDIKH
ncbi:hypothetical protein [Kordia sp.]|uniref:hypothetical protein n=1 Tax=Kordia sp. TaxID=1965332 RepID=UPI003D6A2425